jgi:hypothetical protein
MTAAAITPDVGDARRSPRIDLHVHMLVALEAGVSHSVLTEHIGMLERLGLDAGVVSSMTVMQGPAGRRPSARAFHFGSVRPSDTRPARVRPVNVPGGRSGCPCTRTDGCATGAGRR